MTGPETCCTAKRCCGRKHIVPLLLFLACRCYDSCVAAAAAVADRRINTLTRVVAIFSTTYGKRIGRKRADASAAKRTSDIVMIHAVGKV